MSYCYNWRQQKSVARDKEAGVNLLVKAMSAWLAGSVRGYVFNWHRNMLDAPNHHVLKVLGATLLHWKLMAEKKAWFRFRLNHHDSLQDDLMKEMDLLREDLAELEDAEKPHTDLEITFIYEKEIADLKDDLFNREKELKELKNHNNDLKNELDTSKVELDAVTASVEAAEDTANLPQEKKDPDHVDDRIIEGMAKNVEKCFKTFKQHQQLT